MTLGTLVLYIGIVAIVLTLLFGFVKKGQKSWIMTFLQNFTGVLFIFSGLVKAADPLGTAYKMEQYFTEFESTFEGTWFSFLAPLFPKLSEMSTTFSVTMIIFEIVLGMMLIMGYKSKLTSWLFLLLVVFFTFLTGFTYLTGYVPEGVNFFSFGSWGPYTASNMKVTDCGCFGDFLKLEPRISFFKDIFLMIPAIYFVFKHKDMHQLFSKKIQNIILIASTVLLLIYCLSNFKWNLPGIDFRPFTNGKDVASVRDAELDAMGSVEIIAWKLKNKKDGAIMEVPNAQYMTAYQTYKADWDVVEQIQSEPAIKKTKISEFEIMDLQGNDVTDEILQDPNYSFMIVCHKLYYTPSKNTRTVKDTTYIVDTIRTLSTETDEELLQFVKSIDTITPREEDYTKYNWDIGYIDEFLNTIKPLAEKAKTKGIKVKAVMGGADEYIVASFKEKTGIEMEYYKADDILLKTIVRSNPGIVLWKEGKIIQKWHHNQLPSFEEIQSNYIK